MPRSTPRDPSAVKSFGCYDVQCFDKAGNLKWEDRCENALYNEGEFMILDVALRGGTAPASFYIGLLKSTLAAPAETAVLADLKAPSTEYELANGADPGYGTVTARQAVARDGTASGWPTLALDSGDYKATSKTVSWTASGNWASTVRWLFLTDNASQANTTGKLFSIAQLSADRTLLSGDTLQVTYSLKLQ